MQEPARELRSASLEPIVEKAFEEGRVALGTLEDLASPTGIRLAGTATPFVLLLPDIPRRNPKHHFAIGARAGNGHPVMRFEGGEHRAIGDSVLLRFTANDAGTRGGILPLVLPNGLELTYGQIVSLGGDFYGIPDRPISDGTTPQDRIDRFTAAYESLATAPASADEAKQILDVMQIEIDAVGEAIAAGGSASAEYAKLGDTLSGEWNRITGGGSIVHPMIPPGRYLNLAATNWDHFGHHAVLAYQAGHAAALKQAAAASASQEPRLELMRAYAKNAFADHYLSDLFSSGHLRTPRKELYERVTPSAVGSLLSRYMHDEDCRWGLIVVNCKPAPERWHAYGDKRYFDTVNADNQQRVDAALQLSVDEIFQAFLTGKEPDPETYQALQAAPDLKRVQSSLSNAAAVTGHISPLFLWDGTSVQRRNDIDNLDDYSWTANWMGAATLGKLALKRFYDPPPPAAWPKPPLTAPTIVANGWDPNSMPPNWKEGAQVRYAVSFLAGPDPLDPRYESDLGPWGDYATVGANQSAPTLTDLPIGPPTTIERLVYRQFDGQAATRIIGPAGNDPNVSFKDPMP